MPEVAAWGPDDGCPPRKRPAGLDRPDCKQLRGGLQNSTQHKKLIVGGEFSGGSRAERRHAKGRSEAGDGE